MLELLRKKKSLRILIVAGAAIAALAGAVYLYFHNPHSYPLPCVFYSLTGFYCPGCGGTRAVRALLSGHPVLSFLYHPVVPYMASVAVWAAASWILYFATGNRRFRPELDDRIAYAAAGIVILNFIIKNGLLVFAGIDVIGRLPGV